MHQYMITTDLNDIPIDRQIIMLDGTVPGWVPKPGDIHYDHHRPGGPPIQMYDLDFGEIVKTGITSDAVFVSTLLDADAVCATVAVLLASDIFFEPPLRPSPDEYLPELEAISWDCDHLFVPSTESFFVYDVKLREFETFAQKVVMAQKQSSASIAEQLGLPNKRSDWTPEQKREFYAIAYESAVNAIIEAIKGDRPWPGERGEADAYIANMNRQYPVVAANCQWYRGCAIFDQRVLGGEYVDPRLLIRWIRVQIETGFAPPKVRPFTLTVRDGSKQTNAHLVSGHSGELFNYTLGSVSWIEPATQYSTWGVWEYLTNEENILRRNLGLPELVTHWGGRDAVGGSSWRDPMIMTPMTVIDNVLFCISEYQRTRYRRRVILARPDDYASDLHN